jgi:uncharacterized membrane protein (UPF0127 family)
VGYFFSKEACRDFSEGRVEVGETKIKVAVAQAPNERTTGLIGCSQLPAQSGMYFPYDTPQTVNFWMKGMSIPLDIVWIADGKVVGIAPSVPPVEKTAVDPPIYNPPVAVTAVLEVAAGQAKAYGLVVGVTVNFVPK